jgi:molecular chaperone DnaK (HSP70)
MPKELPILAIDLGTGTCLACVIENDRYVLISDDPDDSQDLMESVYLARPDGRGGFQHLVGKEAIDAAKADPELRQHIVRNTKRKMHLNIPIGDPPFSGKRLSPTEISALFLMKLRSAAERRLRLVKGERLTTAVVTVPAEFTSNAIEATKKACQLAGFHDVYLLEEPVAVAYSLKRRERPGSELALIADLGQGTFDLALVRLGQSEGKLGFRELARGGDSGLGGEDWTRKISEMAADQTTPIKKESKKNLSEAESRKHEAEYQKFGTTQEDHVMYLLDPGGFGHEDLFEKTEKAKRDFYSAGERGRPNKLRFEYIPIETYYPIPVNLNSDDVLKELEKLEVRCVSCIKHLLDEVSVVYQERYDWSTLDNIYLAGGGARVWTVRNAIREHFIKKNGRLEEKREPVEVPTPQHAVVKGAAIHAKAIQDGLITTREAKNSRPRAAHTLGLRFGPVNRDGTPQKIQELVAKHTELPLRGFKPRQFTVTPSLHSTQLRMFFAEKRFTYLPPPPGSGPWQFESEFIWEEYCTKIYTFPPAQSQTRYRLNLVASANHLSKLPNTGNNLVVIANVNRVLHFRIFDADGTTVVDRDETQFPGQSVLIATLKQKLKSLWNSRELSDEQSSAILASLSAIIKHQPRLDGKEIVELVLKYDEGKPPEIFVYFRGELKKEDLEKTD